MQGCLGVMFWLLRLCLLSLPPPSQRVPSRLGIGEGRVVRIVESDACLAMQAVKCQVDVVYLSHSVSIGRQNAPQNPPDIAGRAPIAPVRPLRPLPPPLAAGPWALVHPAVCCLLPGWVMPP